MRRFAAFTLAELLIALAILGVIATFTIPKVLSSQQDSRFKSIAKEAAGTISAAYQAYQQQNTASGSTTAGDLFQYINYVKWDTTSTIDDVPTLGSFGCTTGAPCLKLHNGAMILGWSSFGGTGYTNALWYQVDPDGTYSNTTNGPGKSIVFFLYYDGSIKDWGNARPNTTCGGSCSTYGPNASVTPSWFSWN